MRKFLSKAKIWPLIFVIILIGAIAIAGNVFLTVNQETICDGIDRYFTYGISVGSISYVFPNRVVFKDIVIKKANSSFALSKMAISFSFWDLCLNGILDVSDVVLYPSEVDYYALSQFLEDNSEEILEIIRNSPGNDINIRIKEVLLDFSRKGHPDYIVVELLLNIQDDFIVGTGFFRADQYQFPDKKGKKSRRRVARGWPLWYRLEGQLKPDGIEVDHLIFKSGNLYSKLWGSVHSGLLKVNGFTFVNTAKQDFNGADYSVSRYFKKFPLDEDLLNVNTYILDIDGRINLNLPKIEIEKFDFTLNNVPVALKGSISFLDPVTLDADVSFYHAYSSGRRDAFFEKANAVLSATWQDNVLNANGRVRVDFVKREDPGLSPETAQIDLKDFSYYVDERKRPNVRLAVADIVYWISNDEHKVSIKDFKAVVTGVSKEGVKNIRMSAPFYDGVLDGWMQVDSAQIPSKIMSRIILTDVDTAALEELLIHFAKFNGRMSSRMNFTNIPQLNLSGDIDIYDGQLTDLDFFDWLGDSFRLPDLKAIDFPKASAKFSINKDHVRLRDIHLKTKDVRVGGYFDIDDKNLVSSRLSLDLSKELLHKSSKFRPILKMFDDDISHLGFDFQLSGNMDMMNFQWLPSEVKRKIQTRIPDFIERKIERDVDEMMEE